MANGSDTDLTDLKVTLKSLGANRFDLLLPESRALGSILDKDENVIGVVFGRYRKERDGLVSRGVLVATDQCVILLNKKPLLQERDEIAYLAISGALFDWVGFMGYVTLHTRMGEIHMRTFNKKAAQKFVDVIKANIQNPPMGTTSQRNVS